MNSLNMPGDGHTAPLPPTCPPLLPLPAKLGGTLLWRRVDIEAWKARLFGLPLPELVTSRPAELVTCRQLAAELNVGVRTLRRRLAEARAAAAEVQPSEPEGRTLKPRARVNQA
jgi:hypothetical protein